LPDSHFLYAGILILSGSVALVILLLTWQHRTARGGLPLVLMMAAMVVWSWTYALHWLFPTQPARFFWLDVTYFGVVAVPALVFSFAAQLSDRSRWLTRGNLAILAVEPILTLILLWTDPYHQLFFGGLRTQDASDIFAGGVWFWINVVYSYSLFLVSLLLLINSLIRSRGAIYRKQIGFCIVGVSVLFVVNGASVLGFHPLPGLDLTPILFIVTGMFFAISLLRFHMFELSPVAHEVLLDQMQDGMIVVDVNNREVDINKAAARKAGRSRQTLIGKTLQEVLAFNPNLAKELQALRPSSKQIPLDELSSVVLDVQVSPLNEPDQEPNGYLITWRDITLLKKADENLRAANENLREKLEQIKELKDSLMEQAIRDPLTGLFNRRFLENTLPKEFSRAERLGLNISFMLIDIDNFKEVNDQLGHETGDVVLKDLCAQLEESTRKGDWVVRYGGDELLVILIDTLISAAVVRAEQLRGDVEVRKFFAGGVNINITLSIGVAAYPGHGKDLQEIIRAADRALYLAKSSGRNRVKTGDG
jgi:diguanylate cyclase (GGDEF)-like protein/PAS domain S-box-containing protein